MTAMEHDAIVQLPRHGQGALGRHRRHARRSQGHPAAAGKRRRREGAARQVESDPGGGNRVFDYAPGRVGFAASAIELGEDLPLPPPELTRVGFL